MRKSFTLVELLVVMGVLAVLVVTILVSLNPAEAGKKARDTKRMKDIATLEAIILQYINDGGKPFCTAPCYSIGNAGGQHCAQSWIETVGTYQAASAAVDLCNYSKTIPIDPRNGKDTIFIYGGTVSNPSTISEAARYRLQMYGSDYEINVIEESKSNVNNVFNDGGDNNGWVERGSCLKILDTTPSC